MSLHGARSCDHSISLAALYWTTPSLARLLLTVNSLNRSHILVRSASHNPTSYDHLPSTAFSHLFTITLAKIPLRPQRKLKHAEYAIVERNENDETSSDCEYDILDLASVARLLKRTGLILLGEIAFLVFPILFIGE